LEGARVARVASEAAGMERAAVKAAAQAEVVKVAEEVAEEEALV